MRGMSWWSGGGRLLWTRVRHRVTACAEVPSRRGGRSFKILLLTLVCVMLCLGLQSRLRFSVEETTGSTVRITPRLKPLGNGPDGQPLASPQIGIFQYIEGASHLDAMDTVACYAARHGYPYFVDTRRAGEECTVKYAKSVFYRKHCYVALRLRSVRWLFVLDADSAIVSAGRRVEEWIDDSKDVILYERWRTGEVVAGNYIIKNSPYGHRFLDDWLRYYNIQLDFMDVRIGSFANGLLGKLLIRLFGFRKTFPRLNEGWFDNADNGALHLLVAQHLIEETQSVQQDGGMQDQASKLGTSERVLNALMKAEFGPQRTWLQECISYYGAARYLEEYDKFVACTKQMVPMLKQSRSIKLYRRGHAFCFDTEVVDDMFNPKTGPMCSHGVKASTWDKLTSKIDVQKCQLSPENFEVPMQPALAVGVERLKAELKKREQIHTESRPLGWIGASGVSDCWPNCPDAVYLI